MAVTLAYSTSTAAPAPRVRGDRAWWKADATARALSLGFSPERVEWALKKYRPATS
jgi:hypothetical protein